MSRGAPEPPKPSAKPGWEASGPVRPEQSEITVAAAIETILLYLAATIAAAVTATVMAVLIIIATAPLWAVGLVALWIVGWV